MLILVSCFACISLITKEVVHPFPCLVDIGCCVLDVTWVSIVIGSVVLSMVVLTATMKALRGEA